MTASPPTERLAPPLPERPLLDNAVRTLALRVFPHIRHGRLDIIEDGGSSFSFGPGDDDSVQATVLVHRPTFYRAVAGGSMAAAFSYINGDWDCDDLVALLRVATRNLGAIERLQAVSAPLLRPLRAGQEWVRRNTRHRARENVAQHYDIGNDLFALMLDETMSYSSGVFERPDATLQEASVAKMDRLCRKLELSPRDHLIEIGSGWGAMAVHAAATYGCRVTTTTVSVEQHALATERVGRAGLSDRVTVLLDDYRDLRGTYTKLVSVEMIEAIGWRYLDTYFVTCSRLLTEDGLAAIQAICQPHRMFLATRGQHTFINSHIFPGGHCPSLESMLRSAERAGDLRPVNVEDITAGYPPTLAAWRDNLLRNRTRLPERFDERFLRTWTLYLCLCEAGFRERRITDVQLLLAKPAYREPALPVWTAPPAALASALVAVTHDPARAGVGAGAGP